MDIRLDGRVALITGATGGIGSAIATEFFKSGATVIITGRNSVKTDTTIGNIIKNVGADIVDMLSIHGVKMDLSEPNSGKQLVQYAISKFGKIDILVNNAAVTDGRPITYSEPEFVEHMMMVNYQQPYQLVRNVLPYMRKAQYGRIINITSLTGQCGDPGMSAYASSKAALHALSQSIAVEYGRYNITANSIAPGFVETGALNKVRDEYKENMKKVIPNHRFAQPNEIADLATFLASERAAYINGQQIAINGGLYR